MKHPKLLSILSIVILLAFSVPFSAQADGIIIPEPPICDFDPCPPQPIPMAQLVIRYHHVTVKIEDQVAITHVDQVFYNPNDWRVEGTYIFPIPQDAAVTAFTLWMDGKPVEGRVLSAEQARQTYEEIVRSMQDPALLEYVDRGAVQARIFPIEPRGERRIELEYTQALSAENGLVRYTYPLSTEKFSLQPLESVSVSVDIRSSSPIRAVYSPSHEVGISRVDNFHVSAGYEASNVTPDTDFALYYSLGEGEALHLLTFRDPTDITDPDGFFLLLLAPRPDVSDLKLAKDVILVLDRSGSMEGEKFMQAQEALRYILRHLNEEDRFNIITFSTGLETYASRLRPAEEANEAIAWVDRQSAMGSTDFNRALLEAGALVEPERPAYLIFLTDGLPTEGEVDSQKILDNFDRQAPENLRLFAFGVGYDVDTFLLDSLAQAHHGSSAYVVPGERLDEALSAFYTRISTPVLTDLELDFGQMATFDIYPSPLPDLFSGSQIIALGRYRDGGVEPITLTGKVNDQTQTFRFPEQVFSENSQGNSQVLRALPRLWATRKIGFLLNKIRLETPDQETIDQIVRLSIRYGIVTPYTSYLVTEDMALGTEAQARIAEEQYRAMGSAPAAAVSGQDAVQKSQAEGSLAGANSVQAQPAEAANKVRIVGSRTFVFTGEKWVDTAFDPGTTRPIQVAFLSDDYFRLLEAHPELSAAFALGTQVIAFTDGTAYEVVGAGTQVRPLDLPVTNTPQPGGDEPTATPVTVSQVKTDEPGKPTPSVAQPRQSPKICLSGALPLLLIPMGLTWRLTHRRQR